MYLKFVELTFETMKSISDHELVAQAQLGNRDAFGQLAQKHRPRCVSMAFVFMHNWFDAEDQAQNALLKAYERLYQFNGESEFSTWLGRITINECLMALRSRRRTPRFVRIKDWRNSLRSTARNPEQRYAFAEWRRLIHIEVARVPRLLRSALLRDLDESTVPQLARRLGVSIAAAKSRLFRARAELRTRLNKLEGTMHAKPPGSVLSRFCDGD